MERPTSLFGVSHPPRGVKDDDYGLLSKKTKNTFEVKSTHATATSTPVCTGADVCASMEVMCEGGAKRKYGLYS